MGHLPVVNRLIELGAIITEEALIGACENGQLQVVNRLIELGAVVTQNVIERTQSSEIIDDNVKQAIMKIFLQNNNNN